MRSKRTNHCGLTALVALAFVVPAHRCAAQLSFQAVPGSLSVDDITSDGKYVSGRLHASAGSGYTPFRLTVGGVLTDWGGGPIESQVGVRMSAGGTNLYASIGNRNNPNLPTQYDTYRWDSPNSRTYFASGWLNATSNTGGALLQRNDMIGEGLTHTYHVGPGTYFDGGSSWSHSNAYSDDGFAGAGAGDSGAWRWKGNVYTRIPDGFSSSISRDGVWTGGWTGLLSDSGQQKIIRSLAGVGSVAAVAVANGGNLAFLVHDNGQGLTDNFLWLDGSPTYRLDTLFSGVMPSQWHIQQIMRCTSDGLTFVGQAKDERGTLVGFVATVPSPGPATTFAACALGIFSPRRRRATRRGA